MKVETITFLILISSAATIIWLERKYPYTKGLPFFRDGFWIDLVWYTLIQSFLLKILIFDFIIQLIDFHFGLSSLKLISHWPIVLQVSFFLITHDLYIYWFHRWQHNSKILWRTHEAHHSVTQVDWIAGSRSHALEIIINQTVEFAPIVLLGADPIIVPIKACIDAVWGMYIHSNIDVRSGRWQYIINGPEMHQWHHAETKETYFANYATKFAFWDWLFGTAYLPNKKPLEFGLPYKYPKDYFLQHAFSVRRFNDEDLLKKRRWNIYLNLRQNFIKWCKNFLYSSTSLEKSKKESIA
jgi:sterol desaturase/sphingolipid hydroxylase (fatty acid hydroxylase superfamily)